MTHKADMKKHAKLLWLDLEMTGLDPQRDRVLEVAAIATDWNFEEMAVIESVVHQSPKVLDLMDDWVRSQHASSGLTERVRASDVSETDAEDILLQFIDSVYKDGDPVVLAGNSIHQDRRFIRQYWQRLDARLHYRMLDVSAWKVVFEGKYQKRFPKPEDHRALEDIRGSIMELKYYLTKVRVSS
ncbi:oligoribonuclease [candidate division TM7 genomosp. GTL1]|nr:oligoribonuclease [candidate division TM7 genomosp. GTL1]